MDNKVFMNLPTKLLSCYTRDAQNALNYLCQQTMQQLDTYSYFQYLD